MEKEKEPEKRKEQFKITEIEDDTKKIILELANNCLNKGGDGRSDFNTDKDIANYIKRELENRGKGSWHVIVGTANQQEGILEQLSALKKRVASTSTLARRDFLYSKLYIRYSAHLI